MIPPSALSELAPLSKKKLLVTRVTLILRPNMARINEKSSSSAAPPAG
jgi:hypothetical protein